MEDTRPLISFIIPVHDVPEAMLRECVESILALSLRRSEREIIIVDDGSAASPVAALGDMADSVVYLRQGHAGVSVARNLGLRIATGRFLQFVDGDDLLLRSPYEHVLDLLRYSRCDMVRFDFTPHPPGADTLAPPFCDDSGPMRGSDLLRTANIHGSVWGCAFSASILGSLRFTPGVSYGEDEEFTPLLLLRAEMVITTTAQAYCYREHTSSATADQSLRSLIRRLEDTRNVIVRLKRLADRMPTADRVAMQRRTAQLTMDYIYNIIVMTRSAHYLERKIGCLGKAGLFPLPNRDRLRLHAVYFKSSSIGIDNFDIGITWRLDIIAR